jgi:hypothetical protein
LRRWQTERTLAAIQARILGVAEERGMIRWEYGAGDGGARGGKGTGLLSHSLTEGNGMPLASRTTPAHRDERAQGLPFREAGKVRKVRTGHHGRPRQRLKVSATDTGYAAKTLRQQLRKRGIRAQLPTRVWKTKKNRGRPIQKVVPRFQAERNLAGFQKKDRRLVVRWERMVVCCDACLAVATIHI